MFLILLVVYSAWVAPFEFGFVQNPKGALLAADWTVDAFFGIDIFLTFFVAYLDKSTYLFVGNHKQIAFRCVSWCQALLPGPVQCVQYPVIRKRLLFSSEGFARPQLSHVRAS